MISPRVDSIDYFYIRCHKCNDQVKIAQNKGGYFKTYDQSWLSEFLLKHSGCNVSDLELIAEQ